MPVTGGDFSSSKLSEAINTHARNAQAVDAWLHHAHNQHRKSKLVFAVDVQHAKVGLLRIKSGKLFS